MIEVETEFITYHLSGKDLHLRCVGHIVLVGKDKPELQAFAKGLQRGQGIKVSGEISMSGVISNMVVVAEEILAL